MITRAGAVRGHRGHHGRPARAVRVVCPTCGWEPVDEADQIRLREELSTIWWSADPDHAGEIRTARHCVRCQPHQAYLVACLVCGDGPILTGDLAEAAADVLPATVTAALEELGWRRARADAGWVCCAQNRPGGHPREESTPWQ